MANINDINKLIGLLITTGLILCSPLQASGAYTINTEEAKNNKEKPAKNNIQTLEKKKGPSACEKDATEQEYEEEISRINELIAKIERGEIGEDYLPTMAFTVVHCLSTRGDYQRLDKVSNAAIKHIQEGAPAKFDSYAFFIYNSIAESHRKRGDLARFDSVLQAGITEGLRRNSNEVVVRSAIQLMGSYINRNLSEMALRVGSQADNALKAETRKGNKALNSLEYYLFANMASAYGRQKQYNEAIDWGLRAVKAVEAQLDDPTRRQQTIEQLVYQLTAVASSHGFLNQPTNGLKAIARLEQLLGRECINSPQTKYSNANTTETWCNSTKSWLYSMRAAQNWGSDNNSVINDYRMALKYSDQTQESKFTLTTALASALYSSRIKSHIQEALELNRAAINSIKEEKTAGTRRYILTLLSIGYCLNELDQYGEALESIKSALQIANTSPVQNKELITELEGGLATVTYNLNGVTNKSANYALKELELAKTLKKRTGSPDLYLSDRLLMMAAVRLDEGRITESIKLALESIKEKTLVLRGRLANLANSSREEFAEYALGDLEAIYSYAHLLPEAAELAFFARLNLHGLIEEVTKRQSESLSTLKEGAKSIKELNKIVLELSRADLDTARTKDLMEKKKELEVELYKYLPIEKPRIFYLHEVAKSLKKGEALIEIKKYREWDRNKPRTQRWGEHKYQLFILDWEGRLSHVDLGDAKKIESSISKALRSSIPDQGKTLVPEEESRTLWGLVFARILHGIKGYKKIFVSPDGEMHKIPWNAMNYLYEPAQGESPMKIELITTGRDLMRREKRKAQLNKIFVVADPAFDMAPRQANKLTVDAISNQRSGKLNNEIWGELPYTRAEGEQVAKALSGHLIVGSQATSERVKKIEQPSILHIATHGFFYGAGQESNPMLTSGLVFAGANLKQSNGSEDAYLTALEASSMNLGKTYLVVLSACSTGDGLIKNGEGVYGLRRALKVAGASNSLLSLWKVDDAATAAFMKSFYEWIARGDSPVIALEKTQSEFTSSPIAGWRHPYYWAAWQLVSDTN